MIITYTYCHFNLTVVFTAEFHRVPAEFRGVFSFKEFATCGGWSLCSRKILLKIKQMNGT